MTVNYNAAVSNSSFMAFTKLLLKWKGSVWKAVYRELGFYAALYISIALFYRFILSGEPKSYFEAICMFLKKEADFIPLTFLLGFYVQQVITRWWAMISSFGWIDVSSLTVSAFLPGDTERVRMMRRNIVRHLMCFQVMVYRDISTCVRDRFPTLESMVTAGYFTPEEKEIFEKKNSKYRKYWMLIRWALVGVRRARRENIIPNDNAVRELHIRIIEFRACLGRLLDADMVPLPLLYTQVVTFTVRLFFFVALFSRQGLEHDPDGNAYDGPKSVAQYFNFIILILQFIFYMGWMKVAEAMLNPFGGDDDDFEINYLIDRNTEVALLCVDTQQEPKLVKDIFWNEEELDPLYSIDSLASNKTGSTPMVGSAELADEERAKPRRGSVMVPKTSVFDKSGNAFDASQRSIFDGLRRRFSARNSISPSELDINDLQNQLGRSQQRTGSMLNGLQNLTVVSEEDDKEIELSGDLPYDHSLQAHMKDQTDRPEDKTK